jgi:competence protein ComEA
MDTKKFTLLISVMTAVVCVLTVVYNFASMPAYGDTEASAVALYAQETVSPASESGSGTALSGSSAVAASSSEEPSSSAYVVSSKAPAVLTKTVSSSAASKAKTSSKSASASSTAKTTAANPVNLNTATLAQLETVPYIGESRAQAIIDYRDSHGAFKSINDLDNVKGFGSKMIAKISKYLTLG